MKKSAGSSVAPKERVNIVFKPATGNKKESVELPLKVLVLGDYGTSKDERSIEERLPMAVSPGSISEVMKSMNLSLDMDVPNHVSASEERLQCHLRFESLRDFEPDRLVENITELRQLVEAREALRALRGPLGNVPAVRKQLAAALKDESAVKKLRGEVQK